MKIIDKHPDLLATLSTFDIFDGVAPEAIQWLIDHAEYRLYQDAETFLKSEEPAEHMFLTVKGTYLLRFKQGNEFRDINESSSGSVTGLLPFSRMKKYTGYGLAVNDLEILALHRDCFVEMASVSYELTQNLVATMSSRIKTFTEQRLQEEKLMSLGKLSAGLAHELNNPAAALVRGADELYQRLHQSPERFKSIITMRVTPEETDALNEILFAKARQGPIKELSLLEREDCKDELLDWFEEHDVDNADDIAETFLDFGLHLEDAEAMKAALNGKELSPMMWWVESTLSMERLVQEIRESADRIGSLVGSIKVYTHMDQSQDLQPSDLHEGIRSSMIMLKHQFKEKGIQVIKDFDPEMPLVKVFPGQINQVWTNLIDNAIDAIPATNGVLKVRTYTKNHKAIVDIIDNGAGIPETVINKIFDPFFTTKEVGKGTGMGLEITRRIVLKHHGEINVKSKPGETIFSVCLPL